MKFKYVKDFEFPADRGFRGGNEMPSRAGKASGAPRMESMPRVGKAQGYDKGGRVPGYDMDRLPAKKPPGRGMDLAPSKPEKGEYQGYAKGGSAKGKKIAKVMGEYKRGKLRSGSKKGPKVTNPKQAMAIALSEAGASKKAKGGIFNDEYMAYESKGPKTRGTARKGREQGRRERRAREAMERAEQYAPGKSLDMKANGGGVKAAVHKHERSKHPGEPLTKLRRGGVPSYGRKAMYGGGKC